MTRRRPLTGAAALVVALALLLSGCVSWFAPPAPELTSVPTDEDVSPALAPYYRQVLAWERCGNGMQCTTASAPLDWSDPARDSIELALVRKPASGARLGSLLVNPGGPGGSGYDFVLQSANFATSARLQERYDIVGFDPRGVGRSSAVDCYDRPAELDAFNYGITPGEPGSDEWIAASRAENAAWGEACLEHSGELLGFVDTTSAARDLDLLRAVLGDTELNYLGYSYGTFLGASFAELYPEKVGRLVLDGAVDPATSEFEVTLTQAVGFESAFRAYLENCIGQTECPFRGTVDEAMTETRELLDLLQASPLTHGDGRRLGARAMFIAIIFPLYNQSTWYALDALFAEVSQGITETAFVLADGYNDRNPDGSYSSNSKEAFFAINCLDYPSESDVATMRAQALELEAAAPVFGPRMSYGGTGCADWPFPSTRERGPIVAPGSGDILVVGTTNDPATPYVWARNMAAQLENGHLVTYDGEGHTAYNKSNACVNDAVDSFFIDGTVPAADPAC